MSYRYLCGIILVLDVRCGVRPCVSLCAPLRRSMPAACARDQRILQFEQLHLNDMPSPFIYKTQISRNLECPQLLLCYLFAISLLPPHDLHHINHTTTLFLSRSAIHSWQWPLTVRSGTGGGVIIDCSFSRGPPPSCPTHGDPSLSCPRAPGRCSCIPTPETTECNLFMT